MHINTSQCTLQNIIKKYIIVIEAKQKDKNLHFQSKVPTKKEEKNTKQVDHLMYENYNNKKKRRKWMKNLKIHIVHTYFDAFI